MSVTTCQPNASKDINNNICRLHHLHDPQYCDDWHHHEDGSPWSLYWIIRTPIPCEPSIDTGGRKSLNYGRGGAPPDDDN